MTSTGQGTTPDLALPKELLKQEAPQPAKLHGTSSPGPRLQASARSAPGASQQGHVSMRLPLKGTSGQGTGSTPCKASRGHPQAGVQDTTTRWVRASNLGAPHLKHRGRGLSGKDSPSGGGSLGNSCCRRAGRHWRTDPAERARGEVRNMQCRLPPTPSRAWQTLSVWITDQLGWQGPEGTTGPAPCPPNPA